MKAIRSLDLAPHIETPYYFTDEFSVMNYRDSCTERKRQRHSILIHRPTLHNLCQKKDTDTSCEVQDYVVQKLIQINAGLANCEPLISSQNIRTPGFCTSHNIKSG